jgi:hypothetical protein
VTRSITADFGNYIDSANMDLLDWGVYCEEANEPIRVDYIKVDITCQGGYSPGTIASSVNDTSEVNAGWDLLGWDKTLPAGTDITFEVRASDTVFLKGDGTPAWQGASVLPTGRYQQWRAALTTTDSANTPILHEVWDLYSW